MTFTELVTEIKDRLNLSSTEADTRIGRAVNRLYRTVTSAIGLVVARRTEVNTNTSIGVQTLTFSGIEKVIAVIDKQVTPNRVLEEITYTQLQNDPISTSSPTKYAIERMGASSVTIKLNAIPQAVFPLYAEGHVTTSTLSGSQEPAFSQSYHDVLIEGVLIDEYKKLEKPGLAQLSKQTYEQRLSDLRMWVAKSAYLDITQGGMKRAAQPISGGGGGSAPNGGASYTQTGLITFDRSGAGAGSPPFAVVSGSGKVTNLDADLLDGFSEAAFAKLADNEVITGNWEFDGTVAFDGAVDFDSSVDIAGGSLLLPVATVPAQTADGAVVWDSNDDLLTVGTGAGRKTMVDTDSTQTITGKSIAASQLTGNIAVARLGLGTFTVVTSTSTGAQNNWAPGVTGNTLIEWNGATTLAATGLSGGTAGVVVIIKNVTAAQVATFAHDSGSSDADKQLQNLITSSPTPIAPNGHITYQHDGTDWKLVGHEQGQWIARAHNGTDFTASAGTWTVDAGDLTFFRYKVSGRQIFMHLEVIASDVSNAGTTLRVLIPGGFTTAIASTGTHYTRVTDAGGTAVVGTTQVGVAATNLVTLFATVGGGGFSATSSDNTSVQFIITFEIT